MLLVVRMFKIFRSQNILKETTVFKQKNMDVQDFFEEWDDSEMMDMEEIESAVNCEGRCKSDGENTDSRQMKLITTKPKTCVARNVKSNTDQSLGF